MRVSTCMNTGIQAARARVAIGQAARISSTLATSTASVASDSSPTRSQCAADPQWPVIESARSQPVHLMDGQNRRVILGVSGGVDSAVSALILKERGFQVEAAFMRNWDSSTEADTQGPCPLDKDREDAREVCRLLDIPFHEVDFVKEYWLDVFQQFLDGYAAGITPNPDILCNRSVKFGSFADWVSQHFDGAMIATGHYAQVATSPLAPGSHFLERAVDRHKDQTYFLSAIQPGILARTLFPVGGFHKAEVRRLAALAHVGDYTGLRAALGQVTASTNAEYAPTGRNTFDPSASHPGYFGPGAHSPVTGSPALPESVLNRHESMGICFIGKRDFAPFLEQYLELKPGPFLDLETGLPLPGKPQHTGAAAYTVGQSARIGGQQKKWFVARKDTRTNSVYLVPGHDHPRLLASYVEVDRPSVAATPATILDGPLHWLTERHHVPGLGAIGPPCHVYAQYRHAIGAQVPAALGLSGSESPARVEFSQPVFAPAPGQQLAVYCPANRICLASSVIARFGQTD
ncbi:hypothetical protein H696_01721 [Fonticula alba]|uniref:tRNA-5-taurinomethyluridine 2-sulfurtransferase n=1 Tax=Fonticula alba TaxID=691883 RepID=A0A058ZEF4_FONAL|nr:hypothetical protein H696_01721 [Fonticula alba]KCV72326.1 hypothetical protein H696_01721 [Fonticula alba]|eukprot:XP_009493904.1 hypothetical protein H696_01721 [Fonticula alba]